MAGQGSGETPQKQSWMKVELGPPERPALVRWSVYLPAGHPGAGRLGSLFEAYALRTRAGTVLIDPARPVAAVENRLRGLVEAMAGGAPLASILTNDMHERDAYFVRSEFDVPVWAPATGEGDYEGRPDRLYKDGDRLPGGLLAIDVEGPFPGDTCLLAEAADGTRILFTGDTVTGLRNDFDPRGPGDPRGPLALHGVNSHPRGSKDMDHFKASLRRVLDHEFDAVCPAHGQPVMAGGKAELEKALAL